MVDHDKLIRSIDDARSRAYGGDTDSLIGQRRAAALQAYFAENTLPAPAGRSQVVDRSVYETVHTLLPSLIRIFCGSSDDVCRFTAVGPDDEEAADQTSKVINYVVTAQNSWDQIFGDLAMDALLAPNGYAVAYYDESERTERHTYEGQSDDQLAALLSDDSVHVLKHTASVDEEATSDAQQQYQQQMAQWQMQSQQAQMSGSMPPPMPQQPGQIMRHDVVIERRDTDGKIQIRVLPPEDCFVSVATPNWTLDQCPYFEYRCEKTLSDLRKMGFEVDDDINDDEALNVAESQTRDRYGENTYSSDNDPGSTRRICVRMIWIEADCEDDGEARLYQVVMVGKTILDATQVARIPVVSMTSQPLPHRHPGLSVAETVIDIQDIRTSITRGGLDNLNLANAVRHVISSSVSLADFLDARPGGAVRMLDDSRPADGHIVPLAHPMVFDQVVGTLEYFDQIRQNRTGASRYFAGTDAGAINKTASGTIALQSAAGVRVEHLARMMAPAVERLFSLVYELFSKHHNKPLTIKIRGKWTTVDPQAWLTKRDVKISVGVGAGNKESMMAQLQGTMAAQMQVGLQLGIAGREEVHATAIEISKLGGFANPDKFWKDPSTLPPPQQMPPPEIQKEQMRIQADAQKTQALAQQEQLKFQAEQLMESHRLMLQAEVDKSREEMQARQKLLEAQQAAELEQMRASYQAQQEQARLEFERWKASLDAPVKLEIASRTASAAAEKAAASAPQPDDRIGEILVMLKVLTEAQDSPAELVRDTASGRISAIVRRKPKVRHIVRGPDGRATGIE